ncbi:MAG: PQQ-binding-like beta-propeller repeat protein [Polyangiaceae bacterium]
MFSRRNLLQGAAFGALASSGLGCDSVRGYAIPEMPIWAHRPGGALSVLFRKQLSNKASIRDEAYERGRPEIDPKRMRVFVPSQDGGLYSVDARNGEVYWRYATKGPVQSEPLYDPEEDVLYFGSMDGALYKIRARDGETLFRFSTAAEVARKPVIAGDRVYFCNSNDTLIAVDRKSGELKYYQHRTPAFGIEIGSYSGVAVDAERVYTAFSDGVVMAYAVSDGAEQWPTVDLTVDAQTADGESPGYLDADATPVLGSVAGTPGVLVAHYDGGVYALEASTGRILWRNEKAIGVTNLLLWEQPAHPGRPVGGNPGPDAPARRLLIATSGRTGLWGIDPDTGHAIWRKRLPEGGVSAPVEITGALMVTTTRYGIFLVEPTRGGVIDGIEPGSEVAQTPGVRGRHAYVMTNAGELIGLVVQPPPGVR